MYLMYTKILTALFFTLSKPFSKVYGKTHIIVHLELKLRKRENLRTFVYAKIFSLLILALSKSFYEIYCKPHIIAYMEQ